MGKKRFYDAVRDLIRDSHEPIEEPARTRPRLSIASLLTAPQTCAACWDPISNHHHPVFSCDNCLNAYCRSCLAAYARTALKDRQMLPLRCAGQECRAPVPLSGLRGLLNEEEIGRLSRFQCELLGSHEQSADDASDKESTQGGTASEGGDDKLEELMGTLGWRRCPDCGTGVERTHGCSHMSCLCGGEFCYSCGERWGIGGFGCPRRCGLPFGQAGVLGLLPLPVRFETLCDVVRARIAALLEDLQAHLEENGEEAARMAGIVDQRPRVALRGLHGPEFGGLGVTTRMQTRLARRGLREAEEVENGQEGRPAKMRLRALVHPSTENRL
ncbi:unnamed protein product [Chondrus crispus]|uniref:IBR domain-containing protein n=1 Tax=Chondrus crispus TaxID=2769 RepID=R7QQC8_CHOCR|nr:unnamed protein product [Chondrus crispus]CDF39575.1 unnamed protein product [Chondrus crispus]|eukprot:XP_005709869.1 unnamed protein product [Chondrus crispus]